MKSSPQSYPVVGCIMSLDAKNIQLHLLDYCKASSVIVPFQKNYQKFTHTDFTYFKMYMLMLESRIVIVSSGHLKNSLLTTINLNNINYNKMNENVKCAI